MNALKNSGLVNTTENIPTWAGICSLLTTNKFPLMHVRFLPFIPHPITETSTVYTAMNNFLKVVEQLDQEHLPVFCDEGFRIMIDIYLVSWKIQEVSSYAWSFSYDKMCPTLHWKMHQREWS